MRIENEGVLSLGYKLIFTTTVLYFVVIIPIPWSGMHILTENRADYYAEWRSYSNSTKDTIARLCNEEPKRIFVLSDDDRLSPYFWHELNVNCPIVRPTVVTPLSPKFLNKCDVILIIESPKHMPSNRVKIARSKSLTGQHIKDFTIFQECLAS